MVKKVSNLDEIREDPHNPREITAGALEGLKASVSEFGDLSGIVLNTRTGFLVAGHQRMRALREKYGEDLKIKGGAVVTPEGEKFSVRVVDWGAKKAKFANIAANSPTIAGTFTEEALPYLKEAESEFGDLFKTMALDDLMGELVEEFEEDPQPTNTNPDSIPDLPEDPITKMGDLWILGEHRVFCGDCSDGGDVKRLMNGQEASICFTSPPYAEQRKEQYGGIPVDEYVNWWEKIQRLIRMVLLNSGSFFINIKPHAERKQRSLYVCDLVSSMVRKWDWLFVDEYCWLRTGIPQQVVNRFKNAFEPIYWFASSPEFVWYPENVRHESDSVPIALGPGAGDTNAARRQGKGGGAIQGNIIRPGMAYPSNVLDFKMNAEAIGHPAAFPTKLPSFFIQAYTQPNDLILDPFLGSGTTLIAAEQLGRKCYGMEIEPKYCDVIVKRWENFTGKKAKRVE